SFLSTEIRDTITLYRPNWLNFNSDNYPARGGNQHTGKSQLIEGLLISTIMIYLTSIILIVKLKTTMGY
ncbi:hypothetical protein AB4239_10850, partial [Vibrio sp. 10N.286.45.C10]|uniref:hypothetical protein n=1 Tax=Vibrio sp. 10N.286.45.C10 TaxID=3229695 RepID=UPI003550A94B